MTINEITVNTNAASSALVKYLNEVEKIAEKVSLSVEDVDMIIRLNRKNLKFQEVVQISTGESVNEVKENAAEPAPARTPQNVFDLEYIASHKEAYEMIDPSKLVCIDNVKVRKPDACDTFKMIPAGLRKIGVKEVHYRYWSEPSEGIDALAKQSAMTVTESKRSEDQERRYFYYKEMAKRNAAKAQKVPMPEEPRKGKYMSNANMASLDASAPARVNKNSIMAAAKRLAAAKAKPAQAPAAPTPVVATPVPTTAVVSEPVTVKKDTQKQMSVEDYANEILAEAGLDEWDVADITDSFKELCGSKIPEPEQVVETATVIAPAPDADVETTFIVPSFEEMMGFGSVSTYVEKDGEVVVDDGKDEEELTEEEKDELLAGVSLNGYTEETPYTIEDIPGMDAGRFEREYDKMLKCIEKGKTPTPYQEALLKEAEENRDAGFMRVEDTTLMVSARVR